MKIYTYTNGPVNYLLVGSPTIEDNIATGFSTNDYLKLNTPFLTGNNNWEMVAYVKVSSFAAKCTFISYGNTSTRSVQVGSTTSGTLNIYLSSNGTSANIASGTLSTNTIQLNTWYYVMVRFTGSKYEVLVSEDSQTWTTYITVNSSTKIWQGTYLTLGYNFAQYPEVLNGYMDLSKTYIKINNNLWFGKGFGKVRIMLYPTVTSYKAYSFSGYYEFENGKLIWANPNIYLEGTGTQYIDTGFEANQNSRVTCKFSPNNVSSTQFIFGSRTSYNSNEFSFGIVDQVFRDTWRATYTATSVYPSINEIYTIDKNKNITYLNDAVLVNNTMNSFNSANNLLLFAVSNNSGPSFYYNGKIFNSQVYNNGTLIRHFVPVPKGLLIGNFLVPSNGMFDIINQTFYPNAGTGTFNIGGIPEDYIIKNDNIIWCNEKIYLQNNSSWNAYINTELIPTNDMQFNIIAQITATNTHDAALMGSGNGSNNNTAFILWHNRNSAGGGAFLYGKGFVINWNDMGILGTKNTFTYDGTSLKVNGVTPTQGVEINKNVFTSTIPIYLFGFNKSTAGALEARTFRGRIYSAGLWSNNIIKRYLVPVETGLQIYNYTIPSNGMWDIVNKKFYANAGAGEFIYGKDE